MGGKLLSSARKLPEADRDPQESTGEAGNEALHPYILSDASEFSKALQKM